MNDRRMQLLREELDDVRRRLAAAHLAMDTSYAMGWRDCDAQRQRWPRQARRLRACTVAWILVLALVWPRAHAAPVPVTVNTHMLDVGCVTSFSLEGAKNHD